jgi:lipoate-protein ligase B
VYSQTRPAPALERVDLGEIPYREATEQMERWVADRRDTPPGASSLVGVWTRDGRKVCSIGMRIRDGITSHGFAVNIDPDMAAFRQFTVCGLPDVEMTSLRELAAEAGRPAPAQRDVRDAVARAAGARAADARAAGVAWDRSPSRRLRCVGLAATN